MSVLAVPVRRLEDAKTRLGPILHSSERADLMIAMLRDVLDAATAQPHWETWVISSDPAVLETADRAGARAVVEVGSTLLGAVRQVEADALQRGAPRLAVLLADLPWVTAASLAGALDVPAPVVAVRAASDGGTNLLVRTPPDAIRARFGRDSFQKHLWAARRARVDAVAPESGDLAFDLDDPDDLDRLLASGRACRALTLCRKMDLARRLRLHA
jgi:2-phospho-L-lactate/phosphoenolpyruvate guanylyltransferase